VCRRGFDRVDARNRRPACGGDAFNAAIYLARASLDVGFATAIGDDPYSDSIVALAAAEQVSSALILRVPGRLPGLCLIERNRSGERVLSIWDDGAPAAEGALDSLICSEKGQPLQTTALPERFYQF
jgi:sugar/nucleoside kinase (ribokinase family)